MMPIADRILRQDRTLSVLCVHVWGGTSAITFVCGGTPLVVHGHAHGRSTHRGVEVENAVIPYWRSEAHCNTPSTLFKLSSWSRCLGYGE